MRRLLRQLRQRGDRAVIHALRGRASNRRLLGEVEQKAIMILSDPVYRGFGPTLEYLQKQHQITVSKETLRQWMVKAGVWKAHRRRVVEVHAWRPRRSRCGELVQWDTSNLDWLEGRGERIYPISMIDDATSRRFARCVRQDTREQNMRLLWAYPERFGRPLAFYTDKAGMFPVAVKTKRQEEREGRDRPEMPATQIARALGEWGVVWTPAHPPQAKGRVERQFRTAQDRVVKGLRVAGARTLEQANAYLGNEYLPWWNTTLVITPASADDAHRALGREHDLPAILSHVEKRQVTNDYTIRWDGKVYQINRRDVQAGMRKAWVRVGQRLEGNIAVRFQDQYVRVHRRPQPVRCLQVPTAGAVKTSKPVSTRKAKSDWMKNFSLRSGPSLRQSGLRMREAEERSSYKNQKERRAKAARRSLAFYSPRPQLLRGSTKESTPSKPKPSDGDFAAAIRGSVADAFFGASPVVASALGIPLGASLPALDDADGSASWSVRSASSPWRTIS